MKEFNKSMLKDGDRLTLRNGDVYVLGSKYFDIVFYNEDLTDILEWKRFKKYDIVKVERIQLTLYDNEKYRIGLMSECQQGQFHNYKGQYKHEIITNSSDINNNLTYQTIWEREEITSYEDMDYMQQQVYRDIACKVAEEQPKKIEPLDIHKFANEENERIIMWTMVEKFNEIIEVLNNGRS